MPKRVKRRRKAVDNNNDVADNDAGWEEYFDYIFPEDENARPNLKLLAMAKMWKKQKEVGPADGDEEVKEEPEETTETSETNENVDADDADIKNESSSEEEDNEEEKEDDSSSSPPPEKRRKNDEESDWEFFSEIKEIRIRNILL